MSEVNKTELPLNQILQGDCREKLCSLPDESIDCVVTSPPYFGLRDYGHAGQIGLEQSPEAFVAKNVEVFSEVRRVLKKEGTLWLNLGDSYATGTKAGRQQSTGLLKHYTAQDIKRIGTPDGLKTKDLIGIPWMVAFALRDNGWYLRQDIIWHKPNSMPESVRDRCTKAHEYIFHFSKGQKYYFDQQAIKVAAKSRGNEIGRRSGNKARKSPALRGAPVREDGRTSGAVAGSVPWEGAVANKRSVWTVSTKPFKDAHFATYPPDLIEPCILAGCPPGGVVLDIFMGAGTTALVAARNGRNFIGIEINPEYIAIAKRRMARELGVLNPLREPQ